MKRSIIGEPLSALQVNNYKAAATQELPKPLSCVSDA